MDKKSTSRVQVPIEKCFEPLWEETDVVLVDEPELLEAQSYLAGCENCVLDAEITFDYLLDDITGCDPTSTEYLLFRPAKCPGCHQDVFEKTLVVTR